MMKGSEIVGFGSFNIPKNFDKIIADNQDLAECTSRIECEITRVVMASQLRGGLFLMQKVCERAF